MERLACVAADEQNVRVGVQGVTYAAEEHLTALFDAHRVLACALVGVQEEPLGVAADAAGRDAADEAEGRRWDDDRPNLLTLPERQAVAGVEEPAEVLVPAAAAERV